jgi:hypothetical protein
MSTRKSPMLLVVVSLVLASFAAFALCPRPSDSLRKKLDCVRQGMTRAEVETLAGTPPTSIHLGTSPFVNFGWSDARLCLRTVLISEWVDGNRTICVGFDDAGHVTEEYESYEPNRLEKFLDWFGDLHVSWR